MQDTAALLMEFSAKTGVSGGESGVARYAGDLLAPYGKVETTPLGSLLCRVREPKEGEPHLLLDAHMDEVGMIVTFIQEEGFLRVAPCGGVDRRLLLASPITVHAEGGPVPGVICSVPPHLTGGEEKGNKKVEEIYIDIGCDREKARELVSPGDHVTINSFPRALLGGQVSGKALDDRAGCVAHLKALEYLEKELDSLGCGLTVLFSSMEEVGGQGAKTAAWQVNPTHCVAVDVSFAHTPDAPREKCGLIGKGPMIGYSPILSRSISQEFRELAERETIPYQLEIMGGRTGTNADHIAVTRSGVRCALLSIPEKYMHTPIEVVSVEDVENTGRLIAAYIRSMKGGNAQ